MIYLILFALFASGGAQAVTEKQCLDQIKLAANHGESGLMFWSKHAGNHNKACYEPYGLLGCYELGDKFVKKLKAMGYAAFKQDYSQVGTDCIYSIRVEWDYKKHKPNKARRKEIAKEHAAYVREDRQACAWAMRNSSFPSPNPEEDAKNCIETGEKEIKHVTPCIEKIGNIQECRKRYWKTLKQA